MQAVIMAAGKGSRLGTLTEDIPKAFLEVEGIPLIKYNIAMLHHLGIRDITIVTGYHCERFEELAGKVAGVHCVYNPFYEMVNVLGSFFIAQDNIKEDTLYLHGDTLCAPEIFQKLLEQEGDMVLPVDFGPCDEEAMKVRTAEGRVVEINKTMPCAEAEGEFIGIAKINRAALNELKQAVKALMVEKEFTAYFEGALQRMLDTGDFHFVTVPTEEYFWGEVDFEEDFERVRAEIPENLVKIARGEFGK